MQTGFSIRGVNNVPYRLVRSVYTVLASKPVRLTPLFRTRKNTGHTGHVPAVPVNFGQYRPVPGVLAGTEKNLFIFFLKFCNF